MRGVLSLLVCLLLSLPAAGAVIHVPADRPTIQGGIGAASDGDTVLVADGIYTGWGNRDIDLMGKAITVRSENGPENCIIDCELSELRAFVVQSDEGPIRSSRGSPSPVVLAAMRSIPLGAASWWLVRHR